MGFNCAVAALAGVTLDDLAGIGITTTGSTVSGEEALSEEVVHAVRRGDQLVLACADPRLVDSVGEVARELGVRSVGAALNSVGDVYVLEVVDGDRQRCRIVVDGELQVSEGEAYPEEAAIDEAEFTEDGVLEAFRRLTGVRLDEAWMNLEFQEVAWPTDSAEQPADDVADEPFVEIDHGVLSGLASVQRAGMGVMGLLSVGVVAEVVFAALAITRDESFGIPVPHLIFAVLALMTVVLGRLDAGRLLWTAASAAVLLVSVVLTGVLRDHHAAVLLVFSAYLVVVIAALVWHARRVKALRRLLPA